jgi:hypothetical protein
MTPTDNIVQDAWDKFRELTIPPGATPAQLDDMQRAFYAGALVLYTSVLLIGQPSVSEDVGEQLIGSIGRELESYTATLHAQQQPRN